tara:strand:- start:249 stop:416 length:168 start_codon:yes stop_codon:yes gene_type:complete
MNSNKKEINNIQFALTELQEKVNQLKSKLDRLCKETGACDRVKSVNKELLERNIP